VHNAVPRDKNLRVLMDKVKTFWVENVLENSVHHAALIELGKQVQADAVKVDHPWETIVRTADQPNHILTSDQKIVGVFDEVEHALLILGEPGSGKTTTLLEVERALTKSTRIFLRKVGGGIFIHRMLMEYFAALETQPSAGSG